MRPTKLAALFILAASLASPTFAQCAGGQCGSGQLRTLLRGRRATGQNGQINQRGVINIAPRRVEFPAPAPQAPIIQQPVVQPGISESEVNAIVDLISQRLESKLAGLKGPPGDPGEPGPMGPEGPAGKDADPQEIVEKIESTLLAKIAALESDLTALKSRPALTVEDVLKAMPPILVNTYDQSGTLVDSETYPSGTPIKLRYGAVRAPEQVARAK